MQYSNLKQKAYNIIIGPPRLNRLGYLLRIGTFGFFIPVIGVASWYILKFALQPIPFLVYVLGAPIALGGIVLIVIGNFSSTISRLHDLNQSGWWSILLAFSWLKYIFIIVLCLVPGTGKPNKFGEAV